LHTSLDLRVCDANDQPNPGLFKIGSMIGDYYTPAYTLRIHGSIYGGNCTALEYIVSRDTAKDKFA
jgi:hypothetical protein